MAVYTASALLIIKAKGVLNRVIYRYTLNISRVGTNLFRPIVLFTALIIIYRIMCLSIYSSFNFYYKMLYIRRKGVWRYSTLPMLLCALIGTSLILTIIV
jgi:hypothetical protein